MPTSLSKRLKNIQLIIKKNLQKAGFFLDEIRELLDQDHPVIFRAFEAKIAEAEERVLEIRKIQASYLNEMTDMKKKLEMIRTTVKKAMADYDPTEEFGINKETYEKIIGGVDEFINELIRKNDDSSFEVSGSKIIHCTC